MALIRYGAVIVDSRGTVGGMTFKATRAGLAMQRKSTPRTTPTQATSLQRARFAELSQDWHATLDASQRAAWRALAAANPLADPWGTTWPLSGLAFYIRTNLSLLALGQTKITDAPATQAVTALATATLAITAPNTATLTFTPTPTTANHLLLLRATPAMSPGLSQYSGRYRQLAVGGAGQTSPWDIAAAYTAKFGTFLAGQQYAIEALQVNIENGARSAVLTSAVEAA